jgi:hypothetical protein
MADTQNHEEPMICPHTGQLIVEKAPKFLGLSLMSTIAICVTLLATIIGIVFYTVDNDKVKRQALVQGSIAIFCAITYGIYLTNYEKSKKALLEKSKANSKGSDSKKSQ